MKFHTFNIPAELDDSALTKIGLWKYKYKTRLKLLLYLILAGLLIAIYFVLLDMGLIVW